MAPTSPPTTHARPSYLPILEIQNQNQLNPSSLFGSSSPLITIINHLRTLSSALDPANISTLNRLQASTTIYNLEYDILLLNTSNLTQEAIPLKIAAHLYLWLVIRELPPSSPILDTVIQRLQNSLGEDVMGWWFGNWERKIWLLWILFVGAVASNGRTERFWFTSELVKFSRLLGVNRIEGPGGLRELLGSVVLQDIFFEWHLVSVWEDVKLLWDVETVGERGVDVTFGGALEDELWS
jgi:hypothetical protein